MTGADLAADLRSRIVAADRLFAAGSFEASLGSARALLDEVEQLADRRTVRQWRGELLGLVGRCALLLRRPGEACEAIRRGLREIHALRDPKLAPLIEGMHDNLLVALAALEPPESDGAPTHRLIRAAIVEARRCIDRHRYRRGIEVLEPLGVALEASCYSAAVAPQASCAEPDDERLLYLPVVLGLLGFAYFHQGNSELAVDVTERAAQWCRRFGDRTGCRIYAANLTSIAQSAPTGS